MADVFVSIRPIEKIETHNNADTLEIAIIGGWQTVVRKDIFKEGNSILFFPPQLCIARDLSDFLNVTNYLSEKTNINGERVLVIRQTKLRGEPSFGLVADIDTVEEYINQRVSPPHPIKLRSLSQDELNDTLECSKYEPPVNTQMGDAEKEHPLFQHYTEIKNLRDFSTIIQEGEEVVITEKIHGTNCSVGRLSNGSEVVLFGASHKFMRKEPEDFRTIRIGFLIPYLGLGNSLLLKVLNIISSKYLGKCTVLEW